MPICESCGDMFETEDEDFVPNMVCSECLEDEEFEDEDDCEE